MRVNEIKIVMSVNILLFLNWEMVIHLGTNPVNGGSPPRENKFNIKMIFSGVFLILLNCGMNQIFHNFNLWMIT